MFAARASWDLTPSALAQRATAARASGRVLLDLTNANPAGLALPGEALAAALAEVSPRARRYEPDPRGDLAAREAIAAYHRAQGAHIAAEHVVLTAGTSEGYAHLFRVLADPGDVVHLPTPGYPLFAHLAELEGLRAVPYRLLPPRSGEAHWPLDLDGLAASLAPESRAVVLIHPHNPTGSCASPAELASLGSVCAERRLALLSDEVFADSAEPMGSDPIGSALGHRGEGSLCAVLSGASKLLGVPQLKVAWIAVGGPPALRDALLARLEFVADAFLSVSPLGAAALPGLFAHRAQIRAALNARVSANRRALATALAETGTARALPAQAGWAAIVEVARDPRHAASTDDALALAALEMAGVLVHPGAIFDLDPTPHREWLVVNLLAGEDELASGARALARFLAGRAEPIGSDPIGSGPGRR
jgi:hypothetical protein